MQKSPSRESSIRAIFLDLGGVVVEIDWKATLQELGFPDSETQKRVLEKVRRWPPLLRYETGHLTCADFFSQLNELLGLSLERKPLEQAFNQLIVRELPGIEMVFDSFQGRLPLYALSNINRAHFDYAHNQFPTVRRFDRFFASFLEGARKPNPEFYRAAARQVGLSPNECLFIDDVLENVDSARRLGFQAYQTINSPAETLKVLRQAIHPSSSPSLS